MLSKNVMNPDSGNSYAYTTGYISYVSAIISRQVIMKHFSLMFTNCKRKIIQLIKYYFILFVLNTVLYNL